MQLVLASLKVPHSTPCCRYYLNGNDAYRLRLFLSNYPFPYITEAGEEELRIMEELAA